MRIRLVIGSLIALAAVAPARGETPLTTAFTYQGQLKEGGAPLDGTADFQFTLWDAAGGGNPPVGGTQVGGMQAINSLQVTAGLFTVALNPGGEFGGNAFIGNARWLQVAVRSPAGGGLFTTLAPRQPLTATPHTLFAMNAASATNTAQLNGQAAAFYQNASNINSGTLADARLSSNIARRNAANAFGNFTNSFAGDVGIGTTAPHANFALQLTRPGAGPWTGAIAGGGTTSAAVMGQLNNVATIGGHNGALSAWADLSINPGGGNVGIGTTSPASRLSVAGDINITGSRLFVGTSGNVGIGTTTPMVRLTVQTPTSNYGIIHHDGVTQVGTFVDGNGGWYGTRTNHPLHFFTNNSFQQMTLTTAGNVGIGTATPASKLSISGDIDISGSRLFVGTSGNVGIGTNTPNRRLTVQGTGPVSEWMQLKDSAGIDKWHLNAASGGLNFAESNVADYRLFLAPGGNVGIDTTTPDMVLDVRPNDLIGNSTVVGGSQHAEANQGTKVSFGHRPAGTTEFAGMRTLVGPGTNGCGNTADIRFDTWECGTAPSREIMRITGRGNVGIGTTTPVVRLTVQASGYGIIHHDGVTQVGTFVDGNGGWYGTRTNHPLHFFTNNSLQQMTLTTAGNVGIGTASPGQKLHVVGNICATGTIGACSDGRFKKNVMGLTDALDRVARLRGVSFEWKREEFADHQFADGRQVGFIAQEVEKVLPEVVARGSDGYRSIDYGRLTPLIVEAVKQIRCEKDEQIGALRRENAALKARLDRLEALLTQPTMGGTQR